MRHRYNPQESISGVLYRRVFRIRNAFTASSPPWVTSGIVPCFTKTSSQQGVEYSWYSISVDDVEGLEWQSRRSLCDPPRWIAASMQLSAKALQDAYPYLRYARGKGLCITAMVLVCLPAPATNSTIGKYASYLYWPAIILWLCLLVCPRNHD